MCSFTSVIFLTSGFFASLLPLVECQSEVKMTWSYADLLAKSNWRHWTKLRLKKGDIVHCKINEFARHVVLATSSTTIAHMIGDKAFGWGNLMEEPWSQYHAREIQQGLCKLWGRASLPNAVQRARKEIRGYKGMDIHYNLFSCNCEHWVMSWANAENFSPQSLLESDSSCDVGNQTFATSPDIVRVRLRQHGKENMFGEGAETLVTINPGECFSWTKLSWWNDRASQVLTVRGSACVRIWREPDCGGHSICVCDDERDLSKRMMTSWFTWDDQITSLSDCHRGSGKVLFDENGKEKKEKQVTIAELYDELYFHGDRKRIGLRNEECLSFYPGDAWANRVSSLVVISGCVEYFVEVECAGRSYSVASEESNVGPMWDKKIASVRPC